MICRCNRVVLPDNGCWNPLNSATVERDGVVHAWGHCYKKPAPAPAVESMRAAVASMEATRDTKRGG